MTSAREQHIKQAIANTKQGENLLGYLTRVSKETKTKANNNWTFTIYKPLMPFDKGELFDKLELETIGDIRLLGSSRLLDSLSSQYQYYPSVFAEKFPEFWKNFLTRKVMVNSNNSYHVWTIDPELKNQNFPPSLRDKIDFLLKQHDVIYVAYRSSSVIFASRHISSSTFVGTDYTINLYITSLETFNRYVTAKEKAFTAREKDIESTHEEYTAFIRSGYGDPVKMHSILALMLNITAKGYKITYIGRSDWQILNNNTLNMPSIQEVNVEEVISSMLKDDGWCESVARIRFKIRYNPDAPGHFSSSVLARIRTQIAPDGTPLFAEYSFLR